MMAKRVPIDTYCEKKIPTLQKTYDGLIDYVDISSVDNTEKKIISYQTIESTDAPSRAKQLLQKGDVLVSTVRPNLNAVAVVEEETENLMVGSTGYCVLRCKDNMDVRYLFNFCQSQYFVDDMSSQATGASYPAVSNGIVRSALIPCCSIEEQREIAEKMDTVSELLALRKQQLAELDELIKSRFIELFGDPISNPKGWKTDKTENHIDLLSGFPFDSSQYTENGINICGGLIIMPQRIEWKDCKHWGSVQGYEEYTLKENDIVIALDRPWISEGFKIAMVDAEHLPALLIQRTARIRAIGINQLYLMYCFLLGDFDKHCNVTGSLVPHISAKDIRSFAIMLPPLDLQKQFATFVEQTDKSKLAVQQSIAELEELKKSLMQQYFG